MEATESIVCRPSRTTDEMLGVAAEAIEATDGIFVIPADALEGVAEDADDTYERDGDGKVREWPPTIPSYSWVLTSGGDIEGRGGPGAMVTSVPSS
jgi:hypothetical protein